MRWGRGGRQSKEQEQGAKLFFFVLKRSKTCEKDLLGSKTFLADENFSPKTWKNSHNFAKSFQNSNLMSDNSLLR